jgi:hypothetical protein
MQHACYVLRVMQGGEGDCCSGCQDINGSTEDICRGWLAGDKDACRKQRGRGGASQHCRTSKINGDEAIPIYR